MTDDYVVKRQLSKIPLIICGPILRKVTKREVHVFLALKRKSQVKLEIFSPLRGLEKPKNPTKDKLPTIQIGKHLHVILAKFEPKVDLVHDISYLYDVKITPDGENETDLKGEGLLSTPYTIGYRDDRLPSFSLPPNAEHLKICHGSCRMPSGEGFDAFPSLNAQLKYAFNFSALDYIVSSQIRPHQLILTGDQIYADDVGAPLLKIIIETSKELIDWPNKQSIVSTSGKIYTPLSPEVEIGDKREEFIKDIAKMSSGYAKNHLIFFEEYVIMYLLVWSDVLWPRKRGSDDQELDEIVIPTTVSLLEMVFGENWKELVSGKRKWKEILANIEIFIESLIGTRKVLANIPTYMIFDDHEVTDDWFLDLKEWDRTLKNPISRGIFRNALCAYAIFQDWGNQPEDYEPSMKGGDILDFLKMPNCSTSPKIQSKPDDIDEILAINLVGGSPVLPSNTNPNKRKRWDYEIISDFHHVIVLDTRTWRDFSVGPAGLINSSALGFQLEERKANSTGKISFVVSPAPVFGNPLVETVQELAIDPDVKSLLPFDKSPADVDYEAWGFNRESYELFIHKLSEFGQVIILSGDVHYAFSNYTVYFDDRTNPQRKARIIQLCASSMRNETVRTRIVGKNVHELVSKYFEQEFSPDNFKMRGFFGYNDPNVIYLNYAENINEEFMNMISDQEENSPIRSIGNFVLFNLLYYDRFSSPTVIPTGPWVTDSILTRVNNLNTEADGPDWKYRTVFVKDERKFEDMLKELDNWEYEDMLEELDNREYEDSGKSRLFGTDSNDDILDNKENQFLLTEHFQIVGINNVGMIEFTLQNNTITEVKHKIWWRVINSHLPEEDRRPFMFYSLHKLPWDLPRSNEAPELFK